MLNFQEIEEIKSHYIEFVFQDFKSYFQKM